MFILITVILGITCLAAGLYIHRNSIEELDDVYISPLATEVADAHQNVFNDHNTLDEASLLGDISKSGHSKEALLSFTQVNQRRDKQIPLLGLPDKALFHIH